VLPLKDAMQGLAALATGNARGKIVIDVSL